MSTWRTTVPLAAGASAVLMLSSACGSATDLVGAAPPEVRTIARAEGTPPPGRFASEPFSQLRLVPDELVADVVAEFDAQAAAEGPPLEAGRYAALGELDDSEVLAVWYSGDSGSCPSYLRGLRVEDQDVEVDVAGSDELQECNADYNPYQQLVVLARTDVPALEDLPVVSWGDDSTAADDVAVDVYAVP